MNAAHTPGPWQVQLDETSADPLAIFQDDGTGNGDHIKLIAGDPETEANLRLIAAAPETAAERDYLLELLLEGLPYIEEGECFNKPSCRTLGKRIRAAIAKATTA